MRQGEAKLHILKLTQIFHHLPSVSPKQLCALAHLGCIREVGTSKYFLVFLIPYVYRNSIMKYILNILMYVNSSIQKHVEYSGNNVRAKQLRRHRKMLGVFYQTRKKAISRSASTHEKESTYIKLHVANKQNMFPS